jgi:hypothetical protein
MFVNATLNEPPCKHETKVLASMIELNQGSLLLFHQIDQNDINWNWLENVHIAEHIIE